MRTRRGLVLLIGVLAIAAVFPVAGRCAAPQEAKKAAGDESNAKVLATFQSLVERFDADHDRSLSTQEQAALVEHVEKTYGPQWAQRAKTWLKAADTNGDGSISQAEWRQFTASFAKRAKSLPADSGLAAPKPQTFMVPMSDGVKLATDVYLPEGKGPFPVILTRTPYNKSKDNFAIPAGTLIRSGYAHVVQDMRGRFHSEGENLPFIGCGWGEHKDGVETLAWILKQPWCNGKIGTQGGSAMGITQNLLAGAAPAGLTAQYISMAPASMYHHASYVGGALRKCQVENWTRGNKFDPQATEIALAHPSFDDYWKQNDTVLKQPVMNVPAVHVGGWFDTFQQGTIDSFVGRQHRGAEGAKGRQKLVIGPWHHGGTEHGLTGDLAFPNERAPQQ